VRALQQLSGHLQASLFITKFRKIFARGMRRTTTW